MQLLFLVALWLQILTPAWGYGTGAPITVCESMLPSHGVTAQSTPSPFTIVPNNTTFRNGQSITVLINGSDYAGVLLQARSGSSTSTSALGTWGTAPTNTQILTCSGNNKGAITHSNENTKNNLTVFTWTPPTSGNSVFFVATVAKSKAVYWVNVQSTMLTRAPGDTVTPGSAADPKLTVAAVLLLLPVLLMSGIQL
ncbi:putative defense protein Hdd11 [Trichomycterus rosablanca]|uniref:putative defense protein Hdd11 n=1 Tax=Trichomycterus rosablanca TaxID=2290929 RepID=UPI002F3568CC